MTKANSANTKRSTAQKRAAQIRPQTWKPGESGNPTGAPKRGESWAEIIQRIGEMTDAEFIQLKRNNPTQKQQAIMAVYMALKNDPQPGVFNAIMERTEGKVADKLEVIDWRAEVKALGKDPDELVRQFAAAMVMNE